MTGRGIFAFLVVIFPLVAAGEPQPETMEPQFPQQQTAGDLLKACASSRLSNAGRERRRYCAGFVSGVEEANRLRQKSVPDGFTTAYALRRKNVVCSKPPCRSILPSRITWGTSLSCNPTWTWYG